MWVEPLSGGLDAILPLGGRLARAGRPQGKAFLPFGRTNEFGAYAKSLQHAQEKPKTPAKRKHPCTWLSTSRKAANRLDECNGFVGRIGKFSNKCQYISLRGGHGMGLGCVSMAQVGDAAARAGVNGDEVSHAITTRACAWIEFDRGYDSVGPKSDEASYVLNVLPR